VWTVTAIRIQLPSTVSVDIPLHCRLPTSAGSPFHLSHSLALPLSLHHVRQPTHRACANTWRFASSPLHRQAAAAAAAAGKADAAMSDKKTKSAPASEGQKTSRTRSGTSANRASSGASGASASSAASTTSATASAATSASTAQGKGASSRGCNHTDEDKTPEA
jgi:hypothetical protein